MSKFQQGTIGLISDLSSLSFSIDLFNDGICAGIHGNTDWKEFSDGLVDKAFCDIIDSSFLDEHFGDGHSVFSESSSFIRADVVSSTHGLAGLQISD